jgi:hypothetical protein
MGLGPGLVALAFVFVAITTGITAWTVNEHLRSALLRHSESEEAAAAVWPAQRLHVRVCLAAFLLSVSGCVALLFPRGALVVEMLLSAYEAYVLLLFFCLMLLHMGGGAEAVAFLRRQQQQQQRQQVELAVTSDDADDDVDRPVVVTSPPPPLECRVLCGLVRLKDFGEDGGALLRFVRLCIVQYAVVKPTLLVVLFVAVRVAVAEEEEDKDKGGGDSGGSNGGGGSSGGRSDSGEDNKDGSLMRLQVVVKFSGLLSLVVALVALLKAYTLLKEGLVRFEQLPQRFLSIKLLVFLVTVRSVSSLFILLYWKLRVERNLVVDTLTPCMY